MWGQEENHLFLFEAQSQWINPSQTGLKKEAYVGLLIESQWLGIKDAPKQQSVFFDAYSNSQKLNTGGVIRNRSRFGEQNLQLIIQSSYPVHINSETHIRLGFQALGDYFSSEYDFLRSVDGIQNDPLLQKQRRFIPNIGVGFILVKKYFWLQGAIPRILDQYLINRSPTIYLRDQFHYFTGIGTQLLKQQTRYTVNISAYIHNLAYDQLTVQLKGTLDFRIGEILVGANSSKNIGLGFQFNQQYFLYIGYFFQFPLISSSALNRTNHSLSMRFKLTSKNNK
jgi:type IX secretion system PorP/SprF family membrane protein